MEITTSSKEILTWWNLTFQSTIFLFMKIIAVKFGVFCFSRLKHIYNFKYNFGDI